MTAPRRALIEDDAPEPAAAGAAGGSGGGGWKPWVIGALAVAVAGGGVGYALSQRGNDASTTSTSGHSASSSHGDEHSTGPSDEPSSAEPATTAPTSAESSAPSGTDGASGAQELATCRASVKAGDAVIDAGKVGSGHWAEHVQAQTDAFAGTITETQLKDIFTRTRLAGPADLKLYDAATAAAAKASGTCDPVEGASSEIAEQLGACKQRLDAQAPVLAATKKTMGDWKSHQADMARSRHEHVPEAQDIWITTWKAAPPNINAWKKAVSEYTPPQC